MHCISLFMQGKENTILALFVKQMAQGQADPPCFFKLQGSVGQFQHFTPW